MNEWTLPVEGLLLMFALGLRHGLDPDHLAMVDAMAYGRTRSWSTGAMFALGHGCAVTAAALLMQALRREASPGAPWDTLLAWLPVVLLVLAATCNLRALLRGGAYRPGAWSRLLPARVGRAQPLAAFAVGILFALVFDTASQIAAWGYAGRAGEARLALTAGLAFTAGMMVVDALDGWLMSRLQAQPTPTARERYRRTLGWATVAMAYGVAAYGAASTLWPRLEADEDALTLAGAAMLATVVLLSLYSRRGPRLSL